MNYFPALACGIAASVGILSHVLYFIRGEHHKQAMPYLQMFAASIPLSTLVLVRFVDFSYGQAILRAAGMVGSFLAGLWTSMIIYRAFFHRLNRFHGPWYLKLTKFSSFISLWRLDGFRKTYKWHQKYGNIVRTGPNELSIASPSAPTVILGPRSQCIRSPWYDYATYQDLESLHSTRDVATHEARRRVWDRGFSSKALGDYEARVTGYTHELLHAISTFSGHPMNASAWFNYFSFDVMGDFAFGKSFNMLKTSRKHFAIAWLESSTILLGLCSPISWAIPIGAVSPFVGSNFRRFVRWCAEQVDERRDSEPKVPDVTSWLLKANGAMDRDDVEATKWLHGDSRLLIVAGSDTVAIVLTHLFYHLAADSTLVERLREELGPLMMRGDGEGFHVRDVQHAKFLNAVINETMRMHPPVPSGVFRTTPKEGIVVDGVAIPGGVNVTVPFYVIGRSEECFARPNEFIPERWIERTELVKEKDAFAPFSLGPYGCIGKQLALMEMRTVVSLLTSGFDIRLAPGEDGSKLLEESRDAFTLRMEDLFLVFEERKGVRS